MRWLEVLALSESYDTLKISISYDSIDRLVKLSHQGKLILLDGDVDNLFPNIHIRLAEDGHTFGGSMVIIDNPDGRYIHIGDVAYLRTNILGMELDGRSVPQSLGAGIIINRIKSMQDALHAVDGNMERVLIGHKPFTFEQFQNVAWDDGMRIAYVHPGTDC